MSRPTIDELLLDQGEGLYPSWIRPYTPPLVRTIAATIGKLLPSRASGRLEKAEHFATEDGATFWSPYGFLAAEQQRLSSGPTAGQRTRPAVGVAYLTPSSGWNLSGVATGWSDPFKPNPGRPPTAKLALGNWTPFAGGSAPTPTLPTPARMVLPQL